MSAASAIIRNTDPKSTDRFSTKESTVSNESPTAPPGWYPSPSGDQRYWDGNAWLDIPAPTSEPQSNKAPSRRKLVVVAASVVVALALGVGGFAVWKINDDAAKAAAAQAAAEAVEAAKEKDEKEAADAAAAAAASQKKADDAARAVRASAVSEIEASITTMAEEHIAEGFAEGPVLAVSCSPVNGGSTDDLTAKTTVFECFVANKDNGDGTQSGYYYNATMNWTTGSYTYGRGRA